MYADYSELCKQKFRLKYYSTTLDWQRSTIKLTSGYQKTLCNLTYYLKFSTSYR